MAQKEINADGRWSLKGMNALVTGGTRGIGHAIVEELAGSGAVVYTCSRNENEIDECLCKWKTNGLDVAGTVCDLYSRPQRVKLMESVANYFNRKLNILVNNAGIFMLKGITEVTEEDYSKIMGLNFEACYHLCQLAHPLLRESGTGSIIFISSVGGVVAVPGLSAYAASKGAMNQVTKNLACEWAKDNIRVNAVAPGPIQTSPDEPEDPVQRELMEQSISRIPHH